MKVSELLSLCDDWISYKILHFNSDSDCLDELDLSNAWDLCIRYISLKNNALLIQVI